MKMPLALIVSGLLGGLLLLSGGKGSIGPSRDDSLSQAHAADRVSQIRILRELAKQPFDGTTDDGRKKAGEWFTKNRFKNRANDFGAYTDAVSEAIAANAEDVLAKELEQ